MYVCVRVLVWVGTFFSSAPRSAKRKEKLTAVINVLRRPLCLGP